MEGKRLLLLGLGNDILSDDSVGLHLVRRLHLCLQDLPEVRVQESCEMGLSLLDFITGYRGLVIVDAVQTKQAPPGYLHEIAPGDLKVLPLLSPHFLGIGEILTLGRQLSMPMPSAVKIFAVEVEDATTIGTALTPAVANTLDAITQKIEACVRQLILSLD
jgi:hydrogenase maturation protease